MSKKVTRKQTKDQQLKATISKLCQDILDITTTNRTGIFRPLSDEHIPVWERDYLEEPVL